jgi:hypothetical protein
VLSQMLHAISELASLRESRGRCAAQLSISTNTVTEIPPTKRLIELATPPAAPPARASPPGPCPPPRRARDRDPDDRRRRSTGLLALTSRQPMRRGGDEPQTPRHRAFLTRAARSHSPTRVHLAAFMSRSDRCCPVARCYPTPARLPGSGPEPDWHGPCILRTTMPLESAGKAGEVCDAEV